MKKLFYLVAAVGLLFAACSEYDDTDLVNRVGGLEQRVTELEETVAALNQDIVGVKTLVEAMQNNVYVSQIVEGETGYEIYFTNGEKISIADGKAGENGKDGSTVTIVLEDGEYYWAVVDNGTTSFLTDDQGNKIPVKGDAPLMRVTMEGETGYWEVSYDNGQSWERILLEDGTPVTTSGGGGGLFKAVYEENGVVVFEFLNGDKIEIELRSDLYLNPKKEIKMTPVEFGKSATVEFEAVGVLKTLVMTPDEWNATYKEGVLTITAPAAEHAACADLSGEVSIIYFGEENQSSMVSVPVCVAMAVEAEAKAGDVVVDYTFEGEVTIETEASWVTGAVAEGKVTLTVEQNTGVAREAVVFVKAADYTIALIVKQAQEVALQEQGYRAGSETAVWGKPLSELSLTASAVNSLAALGDKVVVMAPYEAPVVLDAFTGEYLQTVDLGAQAGKIYGVTADKAGHLVLHTFQNEGAMQVYRMKDLSSEPELIIEYASTEYGKRVSVAGDIYGNALVTSMYGLWTQGGTTGHQRWTITAGTLTSGPDWSKIAGAGTNTNGDVVYLDPETTSPYFMIGYSSNVMNWAENGTCLAQVTCTATMNEGAVCVDAIRFNNAAYVLTASDSYFSYGQATVELLDATNLDSFAVVCRAPMSGDNSTGWSVHATTPNTGALTDCALSVSEDGVYMYAYVVFANGSVGCMRVDCLAE